MLIGEREVSNEVSSECADDGASREGTKGITLIALMKSATECLQNKKSDN